MQLNDKNKTSKDTKRIDSISAEHFKEWHDA